MQGLTPSIGYDRFMKPAERAQAALTEAIYAPTPKVQKVAEKLPAAKRMEFIQRESEKRVAAVEKELKKLGLTIAEISGQKRTLRLEKSQLMRDLLKARNIIDQGALKMVQAGASLADIKRRWGMKAEEAEKLNQAARAEIGEKIRTLLASGMSRDEVVKQLGGRLNAGELAPAGSAMSPAELNALVEQMLADDFGLPKAIPAQGLSRAKKKKEAKKQKTDPITAQWSRPVFEDGMNSYEFDTKDRAGIMDRVETIRALAHAAGSIDKLQGAQRSKALELLKDINGILTAKKLLLR